MVIRLQKCAYSLFSACWIAGAFSYGPAHAAMESGCYSALLDSFDKTVDASACDFLRMEDGRIAGISSEKGMFFQSSKGEETVYVWINTQGKYISIIKRPQKPWGRPIKGIQTFPDAKSFYFPFFTRLNGSEASEYPNDLERFCPNPKEFSLGDEADCN